MNAGEFRCFATTPTSPEFNVPKWMKVEARGCCHRSGDLLFAAGGQILRAKPDNLKGARTIADFNDRRFANVEPTMAAQTWPARR